MFFKISVLKNFAIFTGKQPVLESLFNKIIRKSNFIKKTPTQVFSCEYCEVLWTPFITEHLWWLLNSQREKLIFKSLLLWKSTFRSLVSITISLNNDGLERIRKLLLWEASNRKTKQRNFWSRHKEVGLKNVDVLYEIMGRQRTWIRRLCNPSFQDWKLIPLHLVTKSFKKSFEFLCKFSFKRKLMNRFP